MHPAEGQPGLRPVVGMAVVLGLVAVVLGLALALRQPGARPPGSVMAAAQPTSQDTLMVGPASAPQHATGAPSSEGGVLPTSTPVLSLTAPMTTATPVAMQTTSVQPATVAPTAAPQGPVAEDTPAPLTADERRTASRPVQTPGASPAPAGAAEPADRAPAGADVDAPEASPSGEPYTGLPVAVPTTAVLGDAELPVGPAGVRSDGARAYAQRLVAQAHAQDARLVEDPALRQVAEQVLVDELVRATPTGRVVPTRRRQGSVTVQIDIVATLPETTPPSLPMVSAGHVPALGIAVGIAGRVEPDYLPDLVAVAAVAYR